MRAHRHLASHPTTPRLAREFVTTTLEGWGCDGVGDVVRLLTSEVVTNAMRHAGSDIDVVMSATAESVRVEVHDHSPEVPRLVAAAPDAETGRGLTLVQALTTGWGVEREIDDGKAVWFEVSQQAR